MPQNEVPIVVVGKPKVVRSTKGRDSKHSSKVYVYRIEDLAEPNPSSVLDEWFGQVDAVARRRAYGL